MEYVVPWSGFLSLIEPYYPQTGGGRQPYPPDTLLRIHLLQIGFALSNPAILAPDRLSVINGERLSIIADSLNTRKAR
jgi:hypothetical protein